MAPPAASPEGVLTQSGLDKREPGFTAFESFNHIETLSLRDRAVMTITGRATVAPRGAPLSKGGIAGVTIGCVVFAALLLICLYPIIVGRLRRHRNGPPAGLDTETAMAHGSLPPGIAQPEPDVARRLSSRDSFAQKRDDVLRGMERQSSKELTLGSLDGLDYVTTEEMAARHQRGVPTEQAVVHHPNVASRRQSGFSLGRIATWQTDGLDPVSPGTIELVNTRADGLEYTEAMGGQSASYYSPTIPSEAFGMMTPPPTDEPVSPSARRSSSRASSIKHNLLAMMRRMSSKDTPVSSPTLDTLGATPARTMGPPPQPRQRMLSQDMSSSPVAYHGPGFDFMPSEQSASTDAAAPRLASPIRFPDGSVQVAPEDGQVESQTKPGIEPKQSPPILPPTMPAPGTVNPMDIMAPSNDTEHAWRTNQQLYVNLHVSPTQNTNSMMVPPTTSQVTTPRPPEQEQSFAPEEGRAPEHFQHFNTLPSHPPHTLADDSAFDSAFDPTQNDIEMADVSTSYDSTHLNPNIPSHNGSLEGDSTDRSTPLPSHLSSGPSAQTTPDTRGTDSSPSPRSDGSSDIRNSTSPYPPHGFQASPRSFMCDECGRSFDQVHKLNHHKRYHERPHECQHPGCGKKFGTKTHLDRHINDKHKKTRKYHCTEPTCAYSKAGGKSFPRKDNWRRHMMNIHNTNPRTDPEEVVEDTMTGIKVEGEL